jgi:hypothetical protein
MAPIWIVSPTEKPRARRSWAITRAASSGTENGLST